MEFFTAKFMWYGTVCLTEQLLPFLVMFVIMFLSLSQSQMMKMTPLISDYFCGN